MECKRITTDARQMGGVPCLRGLWIAVATIFSLVAEGETVGASSPSIPTLKPTMCAKRFSSPLKPFAGARCL